MVPALSRSCQPILHRHTATGRRAVSVCAAALASGLTSSDQQLQQQQQNAPVTAAYIHLPFCKRKCFYCDFPVEAVGLDVSRPRIHDRMQAYVDLVCSEIRATAAVSGQPLETVSFGGGTPSLVPPQLLELLLETLQRQFGIAASAEVSLEADPGTFDAARLLQYKALGITRLSMGVQSFQEELLQACGRSHSLADVAAAIEAVQAAGFPSWSLDLISGLPRLTLDGWRSTLQQAVAAGPDHISVYDLQVEEGTPFARWYSGASSRLLPREPEAVAMFELAAATLTAAGYEHYEISNYAKPGHRSRHNQVYWLCQPYYAFGLGAASYTSSRRFTRPRAMAAYQRWVQEYVSSGSGCPAANLPAESQEELLLDRVMLSLRTSDGLDLQQLQQSFDPAVVQQLLPAVERFADRGLMQLAGAGGVQATAAAGSACSAGSGMTAATAAAAGGQEPALIQQLQRMLAAGSSCRVRLTDPAGFLLSNDIIAELFARLDVS